MVGESVDRPAPSRAAVALRPLGYLLVAVVWTVLAAVTLGLSVALLIGLGSSGWHASGFFTGPGVDTPVLILEVIVIAVIWAASAGYGLVALPLATAPLAVLSWTYVVRSLRPSFAGERLSWTRQSRRSIGPVTVSGTVAMSLLPVRSSAWTDGWMQLYRIGWTPSRALWFAALPWGFATFLLPGWLLWPVGPVMAVVWSVLTAAALACTVWLTARAVRRTSRRR
jgi:hypothetical protein